MVVAAGGHGCDRRRARFGRVLCTAALSNKEIKVTFTVQDVAHPAFVYQPADNADPDGDSDGTSITVSRPE